MCNFIYLFIITETVLEFVKRKSLHDLVVLKIFLKVTLVNRKQELKLTLKHQYETKFSNKYRQSNIKKVQVQHL